MKDNVVDETHALVMKSAKLVSDIQNTNEELAEYYRTMIERHNEVICQAMGINEQYGYVLIKFCYWIHIYKKLGNIFHRAVVDLLKGNKRPKVGETSEVRENLPKAYAADVRRYLDDIYTSLQGHSKDYNGACDQMIREFETFSEAWIKMLRDLKEQGDEMQNQKVQLRVQFHEFKNNVNPWGLMVTR